MPALPVKTTLFGALIVQLPVAAGGLGDAEAGEDEVAPGRELPLESGP